MTSMFPNLGATSQSYQYLIYQQHLTVGRSHLLKAFSSLGFQSVFPLPKDGSFSLFFGGSTSYSQSLNTGARTSPGICLYPVFLTTILSYHFEYHLNTDDAQVCISPNLCPELFLCLIQSPLRRLASISAFTGQALSSSLPPSKVALPIVFPILFKGNFILSLLMFKKKKKVTFNLFPIPQQILLTRLSKYIQNPATSHFIPCLQPVPSYLHPHLNHCSILIVSILAIVFARK